LAGLAILARDYSRKSGRPAKGGKGVAVLVETVWFCPPEAGRLHNIAERAAVGALLCSRSSSCSWKFCLGEGTPQPAIRSSALSLERRTVYPVGAGEEWADQTQNRTFIHERNDHARKGGCTFSGNLSKAFPVTVFGVMTDLPSTQVSRRGQGILGGVPHQNRQPAHACGLRHPG
jgi:hypothetical protein